MPVVTDVEVIRNVYDLAEKGLSGYRISKITGLSSDTVAKWLKYPNKFSPHLDEVALERALNGDRRVFDSLSNYERRVFWQRAGDLSWRSYIETKTDKDQGYERNPWVNELAARLGYEENAFSAMCGQTRRRTAAAA